MYNKLHKINLKKMLASLVSILMLTSNINLSIFADEEPAVSEVVNEGAAQGAEEGGFDEEAGNADDGANLDSSSDDSEFSSESSSKSYEDEESQGEEKKIKRIRFEISRNSRKRKENM